MLYHTAYKIVNRTLNKKIHFCSQKRSRMAAAANATRWCRRSVVARTAPTPTRPIPWTCRPTARRLAHPATPRPRLAPALCYNSSRWSAPAPPSRRPATASTRSSTTTGSSWPSRAWPTARVSPPRDTKLVRRRIVSSRTT